MEPLTRGERALAVLVAIGGVIVIAMALDLLIRGRPSPVVGEAERITQAAVND